ncbi:MAG: hypothetical protein HOG89_04635 [Candidatus Peribacter sp.]|jgi:hypothetical protein|nr:hypothetical protein [Candidatus Peribacter sp.]MBT4393533.1 hypothetical protein [Candidatus Peribacter sp.]MBT4601250.1 hypothetical protein [Candidatus Peribacter sp.]MBT5149299.1 hypothetical protein [Candidatus Peribacter sp.]MBT5638274.1 hypothetical protein [Candidatus Peribacter sp.]
MSLNKQKPAIRILGILTISILVIANTSSVYASSSWGPTLIVNTEAFQQIDGTDTSSNYELRFGNTGSGLILNITANQFEFDTNLEIQGTASGRTIHAQDRLTSSGTLVFEGAASGASLYVADGFAGSGLEDCDTASTSKLLWDATTQRFSCGTDTDTGDADQNLFETIAVSGQSNVVADGTTDTLTFVEGSNITITTDAGADTVTIAAAGGGGGGSSFSGTGSLQEFFDNRYVHVEGDTMTGGLLIDVGTGNESNSIDTGLALEVVGTSSGEHLHFGRLLTGSGQMILEANDLFSPASFFLDQNANGSGQLIDSESTLHAAMIIDIEATTKNTSGEIVNPHILFGHNDIFDTNLFRQKADTLYTDDDLWVGETASGARVHATDSLTSSGTLSVEGQTRFKSATDSTTFFQVNDTDGGTTIFNVDTTNERVGIGDPSPDGKLDVNNTDTSTAVVVDQDGNGIGIDIDTEATTVDVINIQADTLTTGKVIDVGDADSLTTGTGLIFTGISNSSDTSKRSLFHLENDNASADSTTVMHLQQDGAATTLFADTDGDGIALDIDSEATSEPGIRISMPTKSASDNPHILFGYDNMFDTNIFRNAYNSLTTSGSLAVDPPGFDVVYYDDGTPSYSDNTTEARTSIGTAFTLFSVENPTNDYIYVGLADKFYITYFDIAVAGAGITLAAEYYNGSGWSSVTIEDNTSNLSQDGTVMFNPGGDWSTTTIDAEFTSNYWIRFSGGGGNLTTAPTAYSISPTQDWRFKVFSQAGDTEPAFFVAPNANVGVGTGSSLTAKFNIYTDNAFNNEALVIHTAESTGTQDIFKIVSDVASTNDVAFRIQANGATFSDNAYSGAGADFAEWFPSADNGMTDGDIVCLDTERPGYVKRCSSSQLRMIGAVSTNPGFIGNNGLEANTGESKALIGIIGQIPVKVQGTVNIGDRIGFNNSAPDGVGGQVNNGSDAICIAMASHSGNSTGTVNCLLALE